jgi:TatD DNase family protein
MIIDTHAHLDFPEFADELDAVLARARVEGVTRVITIGTSLEGSRRAVELAHQHPEVFAVIGVHPGNALEAPEDILGPLRELARHPKVVAIGECGLDYHRLPPPELIPSDQLDSGHRQIVLDNVLHVGAMKHAQAAIFEQQLDLAAELGLNVVVHERDAWQDTVALLEPYTGRLRAVFHCFGKSIEHARALIDRGHLVSFTGIVTFKNAPIVQDAAAQVPQDAFMVETDCPYLAPVPHRGKRGEPAFTRIVAEKIASLRGVSVGEVARQTMRTAETFFRFVR